MSHTHFPFSGNEAKYPRVRRIVRLLPPTPADTCMMYLPLPDWSPPSSSSSAFSSLTCFLHLLLHLLSPLSRCLFHFPSTHLSSDVTFMY
ncbi:hypothetical protein E2C01_064695 [Portunus trituberculatus]|uniref:Uncharacterized protein n=1 Tax=Portunus trituberculatus TaxID=210409 RepID=A0A5B7HKH3_PORTR|nr:hypothetical protein [Portunus trituberculatus]